MSGYLCPYTLHRWLSPHGGDHTLPTNTDPPTPHPTQGRKGEAGAFLPHPLG